MLGYDYGDIQVFGSTLNAVLDSTTDPNITRGVLDIWNFFEGLLVEGYISE